MLMKCLVLTRIQQQSCTDFRKRRQPCILKQRSCLLFKTGMRQIRTYTGTESQNHLLQFFEDHTDKLVTNLIKIVMKKFLPSTIERKILNSEQSSKNIMKNILSKASRTSQ